MCTATCPTYQLLGDELDGPRGRIYLIKEALENGSATAVTRRHLDRCLLCRACETACPSGVEYGRLLEIGRKQVAAMAPRSLSERWLRRVVQAVVSRRAVLRALTAAARATRWLLPESLRRRVPSRRPLRAEMTATGQRRVVLVRGCAQDALTPRTLRAAQRVLARLGVASVVAPSEQCCGALSHHLEQGARARELARRNVDAWLPLLKGGAEAIVSTATGCGLHLRDYGALLADEPDYAEKAAEIARSVRDVAELEVLHTASAAAPVRGETVVVHQPCTWRHGGPSGDPVSAALARVGFDVVAAPEDGACCGSAGSYSLLQPDIAESLRRRKLAALTGPQPTVIATANVGCQLHLGAASSVPVRHWMELMDEAMSR